jgi:uncharacterized protein (DUF1015 family)
MAQVKPFAGLRFNLNNPEDLGRFVAPPYDMLDDTMLDDLNKKNQYNVVRIIQNRPLPSDTTNMDRHRRAAALLCSWVEGGVIIRDGAPSFYFYQQQFTTAQGGGQTVTRTRTGVIALVKLVDYEAGVVFPHEYTLTEPKVDRYELLNALKAHAELIFGIVQDPDGSLFSSILSALPPAYCGSFIDSNAVRHSLFHTSDRNSIASLTKMFSDRTILIADGHHRYETALQFYRDTKKIQHEYVLMNLVSMADPGLTIRAFHRVLKKYFGTESIDVLGSLATYFDCTAVGIASYEAINRFLESDQKGGSDMLYLDSKSRQLFGLSLNATGKQFLIDYSRGMSAQWNQLDVSKINSIVVGGIFQLPLDGTILHHVMDYVNDPSIAFEKATTAEASTALHGVFFIKPVDIKTINSIVMGKERMPQKSTNFFPKCYSGLVFNTMEAL